MAIAVQSQNPFSRKVLRFVGWLCFAFGSVPILFLAALVVVGLL